MTEILSLAAASYDNANLVRVKEKLMTKEKINRINELARKQKTMEGLTPEEKAEQATLREEYIQEFRNSMRGILDNTYIQYADGTKKKVEPKNEKK